MNKTTILFVEDDPYLGFIIKDLLESKDYNVLHFSNAEDAFKSFTENLVDICVFDVMLPGKDGFGLARDIREIDSEIPIIFLTAKSLKEDVVEGFRVGADDYIKKPFSMDELVLRLSAILRRSKTTVDPPDKKQVYSIGKFTFYHNIQKLKTSDKTYNLTYKENELLKLLCDNMNKILDRKIVLEKLWKEDNFFNARSMDVYIAKLRKYLKDDPDIEIINIRAKGFKLITND